VYDWVPGPVQGLTATVLGAAAISSAATPASGTPPLATADTTTVDVPAHPPVTAINPTGTTTAVPGFSGTVGGAPSQPILTRTGAGAAQRSPAAGPAVYQVQKGDWLGAIAQRYLGDFDRYPQIQHVNPDLIPDGSGHRGPDHIEPGWRLILPAAAHDHGEQRHATGHAIVTAPTPRPGDDTPIEGGTRRPEAPSRPAPVSGDHGTSPPGTDPRTPTRSRPAPNGATATATAVPKAPTPTGASPVSPMTQGSAAAADPDPPNRTKAGPGGGVDLLGGWVSLPLAAAITAAAAMVWLKRRHRYSPQPPGARLSDDSDLRPLPAAVNRLRQSVRAQAPELLDAPTAPEPTVADYAESGDPIVLPPVGVSGAELTGLTSRVPAAGLGLLGDGADAAARALLVAVLSTGSPPDPDARGEVIVPADTMTSLLGAQAATVQQAPRLTVTAGLSEALTRAEEKLIERRRLLQEYDATDLDSMRTADPFHPPMPPVTIITEIPAVPLRARLTTMLHLGSPLQISAVLLGPWPGGETLTVHADGHTAGNDATRLSVLDVPTTMHLLEVLHEAHTGQRTDPPSEPRPQNVTNPPTTTDAAPQPPSDSGTATTGSDNTGASTADNDIDASSSAQAPSTAQRTDSTSGATPTKGQRYTPVRIRLLGTPTIVDHNDNPIPALRHHARELLVYLAVHRAGADLSDIMEAFWPDATVRRAGERLSTEAGDLRRHLRQAAADPSIRPVVNTGGRYHLDPHLLRIDMWDMLDALREAAATADPTARRDALHRAVAAHTDPLADGCDYDWIDQPREQIRRHGIHARRQLAELLTDADPRHAAELLQAAADLDPYNEDLAQQAIHALARIGDTPAVHAQLDQLRTALNSIDEEPSPTSIALAARLGRENTNRKAPPTAPARTTADTSTPEQATAGP
jgi:DNA-binding SARP family transcriptional activator